MLNEKLNVPDYAVIRREDWRDSPRPPRLSVIVPSRDGHGGGLIDRLRDSLRKQSFRDFEFILVIGDNRQGRAINNGARSARGDIVMTMDDDTVLLSDDTIGNIVRAIDADPAIGMAGASTVVPPDASCFQHRASREIPRRFFPVQAETVDSDMVQHPCLAMPKKVFFEIGGEDEELVRGLDPLLRYKTRCAGYRVVIVANTAVAHVLPEGIWKVMRQYARNGKGSAFARKFYSNRIYESAPGYEGDDFKPVRPFPYRAARKVFNLFYSLASGKIIRFAADVSYIWGYATEYFFGKKKPEETKV